MQLLTNYLVFNLDYRYLLAIGFLSAVSGLCFALSGSTLMVFLVDNKININTAGLFILSHLPYAFKWLIVPFLEKINHQDHRQLLLKICLVFKSLILICFALAPNNINLWFVILTCLHLVAAVYDSVLLVSQVAGLNRHNWGFGEAAAVSGFRIGILVGGAGALFFSSIYSWKFVYIFGAILILLPLIVLRITKVHLSPKQAILQIPYLQYLKMAWSQLSASNNAWWLIGLMIFYRAQDGLQGKYPTIYFMSLGYEREFLSLGYKVFGIFMAIAGGFFSAWIIRKFKIMLALRIGIITHALSVVGFIFLGSSQFSKTVLILIVGIYEFSKGVAMTPFFSKQIMSCGINYAMVQLAFLTSIASLASTIFGSLGGELIDNFGWNNFWLISILVNIPAIIILYRKKYN